MVTTVDSPPPAWDALDADPPLFASRGWLAAMGHRVEGEHRWYLHDGARGAEVGFFGTMVADPGISESKNPWRLLFEPCPAMRTLAPETADRLAAVRAAGPSTADFFPSLVLTYPGLECFPIGPGARSGPALDAAIAGVIATARAEGARTVTFLYVQPEDEALVSALRRAGLVEYPTAVRANLRLPGDTFADYLAGLRRDQRHGIERVRRRLAERGVSTRRLQLSTADTDTFEALVGLRLKHREKYGKRPDETGERRLLAAFQDGFGDRVTVFLAVAGDRTIGFALVLDAGEIQHVWTSGTDYTDPRSSYVYFEVTYHAPIEAAYQTGVREISFGYGTERTKVERGCRLDVVHSYVLAPDEAGASAARQAAAALAADPALR
jgi:hypothetical protein